MKPFSSSAGRPPIGVIRFAAILVGVCLILSGCKNPKGTTWAGAAIGALAGAAAGAAIDGSGQGAAIGAAAGAVLGAGVGYLVYRKQLQMEANIAASRGRVNEAEVVLKKYRRYNEYLASFTTNASTKVKSLNEQSAAAQNPADVGEARKELITQIDEAEKGGRTSVEALKAYRVKVESSVEATAEEEARRKKLQRIEELKQEEARLIEQLDVLTGVRGQAGGGG